MRVKDARCPECGATVSFAHAASALAVCAYCRSVLARGDVDVEKIGKVAMLADVPSPLAVGMRGSGYGGFQVAGRLQLDYGAGTWNEWYLALDSGKWLWLAEAQGRLYLTAPMGEVEAPPFDEIHLGRSLSVPSPDGNSITMHAVEVHTARMVSAEGELPFRVTPGAPVSYVDLSGPRRSFGTLDYGDDGSGPPQAYVGRQADPADLGLSLSRPYESLPPKRPAVKAARMECPNCHGALALRAPDLTLRVTCPYCAALVDVSEEPLKALATVAKDPAIVPRFPLGAKATLRGTEYTVLGHLRRRLLGGPFTWDEYVLAAGPGARGGFHYLIESGGHFTLVRPIHYGDLGLSMAGGDGRSFGGRDFRPVERCVAQVEHVSGEFPWEVEVGEEARVEDYWADGALLSVEESRGPHPELNASLGDYLERREVLAAFGLKDAPPYTSYIAPHQPNLAQARYQRQKTILWPALAAMALLMMVFSIRAGGRQTPRRFDFQTVAGVEAAAEHIFLSEPFTLTGGRGALALDLSAPALQDSWLDADVALINDEDGTARSVGLGASFYSGVDDGESWSEGSRSATVVLPSVPAGRYVLRVEPAWPALRECTFSSDCGPFGSCEGGKCRRSCGPGASVLSSCRPGETCVEDRCVLREVSYSLTLRHGVGRLGWGFFFSLLILLVPLWSWLRARNFEARRQEDMTG